MEREVLSHERDRGSRAAYQVQLYPHGPIHLLKGQFIQEVLLLEQLGLLAPGRTVNNPVRFKVKFQLHTCQYVL